MRALADLWVELSQGSDLDPDLIQPSPADQPSDVAMACFQLARRQSQPPHLLAQRIADQLSGRPGLSLVEAVGGYVNLKLDSQLLARRLGAVKITEILPAPDDDRPVVIDYFSPNIAKPVTVGHLRNLLLGRALVNLHRFGGYRVITDNHIGDWGRNFGLWVVGFLRYSDDQQLETGGVNELGRVYVKAAQALKEDPALDDEIQSWLLRLQSGDEEAVGYHRRFSLISMGQIDKLLQQFGIEFDHVLGESFYQQQAEELIAQLIDSGQATTQDDGSVIVDLTPVGIDTPLLIRKSNGAHLYASSDIATLQWREQNWQPQRIIYVVGNEQKFHFRQLFAFNQLVKLAGSELIHYAYGLIEERAADGGRQKMSSRTGAVGLEEVIDQAWATVRQLVKPGLSQDNQGKIVFGALAFLEFSHSHSTNILFDWESVFNLQGYSGPYVQYAVVRLKSILTKSGQSDPQPDFKDYDWQAEHQILISLLGYNDVLAEALKEHEPSQIANHVWQLARQFNRYYEQTSVLSAEATVTSSRLWLIDLAARQMSHALGLLGIEVPDEM